MKSTAKKIQIWLLFLSLFMPNFFNFRLIGMNITFGRTVLLIIFLLCLYRDWGKVIFQSRKEIVCMIFFFYWVTYGILLMMLKSIHKAAVKEVISIFQGAMTVYCIVSLIRNSEEMLDCTIECLRKLEVVCILVGLFEIITGKHLGSSCFCDPNYIHTLTKMYGSVNRYQATGFQYGTNDYCSFLIFFVPVFFLKRKGKILDYFMIGAVAVICAINSSTLCMLTLILGMFFFFIKKEKTKWQTLLQILAIIVVLCMGQGVFRYFSDNVFSLSADLKNHLNNYYAGGGSSYSRVWTYIGSFTIAKKTFFAGLGPANFTPYVTANPMKGMLLNPHNLWLEILTQYGIVIFGFYTILLGTFFYKSGKIFRESGAQEALLIQVMVIAYIIAGIVPSTFISYLYQWVLLGLGIEVTQIYKLRGEMSQKIYGRTGKKGIRL